MHLTRLPFATSAALLLLSGCAQNTEYYQPSIAPQTTGTYTRCQILNGGIQFSSYLPDKNRYLYLSLRAQVGAPTAVFMIIDKNYDNLPKAPPPASSSGAAPAAPATEIGSRPPTNPTTVWWLDRTRPMAFSTDQLKGSWHEDSGLGAIANLVVAGKTVEATEEIRGLTKHGKHFEGQGSSDANTFAFQTRLDLFGFTGDEFDVTAPAITYDGTTLVPPLIHFKRLNTDDTPKTTCS